MLDKWEPLCNSKHASPLDPKTLTYLRKMMALKSVCIFKALEIAFSSSDLKKKCLVYGKIWIYSSALQKSVIHYMSCLLVVPFLLSLPPSVAWFLPLSMFSPKENSSGTWVSEMQSTIENWDYSWVSGKSLMKVCTAYLLKLDGLCRKNVSTTTCLFSNSPGFMWQTHSFFIQVFNYNPLLDLCFPPGFVIVTSRYVVPDCMYWQETLKK